MAGYPDDMETLQRIKKRRAVWPPTAPSMVDPVSVLVKHARGDTGGSGRCAMFLLSLWNGHEFKADLQELLYNETEIFSATISVLQHLFEKNEQIDNFVSQAEMDPIISLWGRVFHNETK